MIRSYFSRVKRKFQEFSSLIKSESVEYQLVSEDMGIINGELENFFSGLLKFPWDCRIFGNSPVEVLIRGFTLVKGFVTW